MSKTLHFALAMILFMMSFHYLSAQVEDESEHIRDSIIVNTDIFGIEQYAEIKLKFSFKDYRKNKNNEKYLPAELSYHISDTLADVTKSIRVRARGNNRKAVCSFPPMRLNIKKADIDNEKLDHIKNIKLVTHCQNSKSSTDNVLKEYLVYKVYQIISPYSFRVRLTKVTYIDTNRKNKETLAWAFMIEPEKMMAERLGFYPLKMDNLGFRHAEPAITNTMTVFNYMIGNADYGIVGRHNVKLLKSSDIAVPLAIPVPYDFDYSGMVNASYAKPGPNLGIESVTERYFTGPCRPEADFDLVIADLVAKKAEILKEVDDFQYLSKRGKKEVREYLESFFESTANKNFVKYNILSTCRELKE
ncbi:MAG: hypothetical protein OCD76_03840 [Reichenbachiella sp.]